ncbi:unnamed protein product [Calypogeia fissa]
MAVVPWVAVVFLLAAPFLVSAAPLEPQLLSYNGSKLLAVQNFTTAADAAFVSALGDPGMRSDRVRVAVEGWDFCNRAGYSSSPIPIHSGQSQGQGTDGPLSVVGGSPRWADCTDLVCPTGSSGTCTAVNRVSDSDNNLGPGDAFPCSGFTSYNNADLFAIEKEKFLGLLCAVDDSQPYPWNFWMVMVKNGNFDENSGLCPVAMIHNSSSSTQIDNNAGLQQLSSSSSSKTARGLLNGQIKSGFPCFGDGCMNQPLVVFNYSQLQGSLGLAGGIYGTYDLEDTDGALGSSNSSFFSVNWYKSETGGSWYFHHLLTTSGKYPWLMLYLRADATSGESGGYPWDTRGMMQKVPQSPNFRVQFTLNVLRGGGSSSQFYLLDMGGCWKNNGEQCDGDLATDVTRYSEMIINPETNAGCNPNTLQNCPPIHTTASGTHIHRNDTQNFPYSAYHYYCVPYNALYAQEPYSVCDPFSNPQPQELMQLLPHPEWAVHGYPASKGEGWIGDGRTWDLDVGALSSRLFFYQDPGTSPAIRNWPSLDIGTEIYQLNNPQPQTAEWVVSDFNVLVPST